MKAQTFSTLVDGNKLMTESAVCCICESNDNSALIGTGKDFEYHTSADEFSAMICLSPDDFR